MKSIARRFWPYDELSLTREGANSEVKIATPWLTFSVEVDPSHLDRTEKIIVKINSGNMGTNDIGEMSWFLSSLAKFPVAYILPRGEGFGIDVHTVTEKTDFSNPQQAFTSIMTGNQTEIPENWTWDHDAALGLSRTQKGFDAETLFTIARRYHLLNDIENNKTGDLLEYVKNLRTNTQKFKDASALIVRQNHYVTEKCDSTLRAALPISQNSYSNVMEFIRAESGHDNILRKALKSLGVEPPESIPTLDAVIALMTVFKFAAERNFLAFAMIVDIFERTSYQETDPMASLLADGGEEKASHQLEIHRQINDEGEHENVALGFLSSMAPVSEEYSRQALYFAELATLIVHQVSAQTLNRLKSK
ncbi:MAG: hypothetical protein A4S09_05320 [Proteobacteria bacterium SG_bin7]|nr:MAG: hypothetical protein A4S09_05320 [Proteobacteria bacterium SG_bin7]